MHYDLEHLQRSVERHVDARHLAWVDHPYPLYSYKDEDGTVHNGPTVEHLTIQKHIYLHVAKSPFIVGGQVSDEQVVQFLHIVSPLYDPTRVEQTLDDWRRYNTEVNLLLCRVHIHEYLDLQFRCRPDYRYEPPKPKEETEEPQTEQTLELSDRDRFYLTVGELEQNHFAAHYFTLFLNAYGWDRKRTFNTPYPVLHLLKYEIYKHTENPPKAHLTYVDSWLTYEDARKREAKAQKEANDT